MEEVSPEILRRVAAQTAAVYSRVHEEAAPGHLLALRIALRERSAAEDQDGDDRHERARGREQHSSEESRARDEGSKEEEGGGQAPPEFSRRTRKQLSTIPTQEKKKQRRIQTEPGLQTQPRRRQGQVPHQKRKTLKQIQQEPVAIEPIDLGDTEPTTNTADQATQTGTRRRAAAENPQDRGIARQDDWRQWLPQRPASDDDLLEQTGPDQEAAPGHQAPAAPFTEAPVTDRTAEDRAAWHPGPHRIVEPDGGNRTPDSHENQWLQQYEAERAEMAQMDELLADFEEEERVQQAVEEFEAEQRRQEREQAQTFHDSESS